MDFTLITLSTETYPFTGSSPRGECSWIFCSCRHSLCTNFHSTWYPLLLVGQRWCGFSACLYMWPALQESNPRPLALGYNALTTRQCTLHTLFQPTPAAVSQCFNVLFICDWPFQISHSQGCKAMLFWWLCHHFHVSSLRLELCEILTDEEHLLSDTPQTLVMLLLRLETIHSVINSHANESWTTFYWIKVKNIIILHAQRDRKF